MDGAEWRDRCRERVLVWEDLEAVELEWEIGAGRGRLMNDPNEDPAMPESSSADIMESSALATSRLEMNMSSESDSSESPIPSSSEWSHSRLAMFSGFSKGIDRGV